MFRPVTSKPDLVAQEHELLETWRERRTFARLRAQNAGGPRWSFLDGPITANNPMGVHHAWGREYKDLYQRFHAMLGEDERYQNGFDCQGLWVEVNVERDLGFTSKRDIEEFGIDRFVADWLTLFERIRVFTPLDAVRFCRRAIARLQDGDEDPVEHERADQQLTSEIVASGTPEDVAKNARSYTGQYLKPLLKNASPARRLKAAE